MGPIFQAIILGIVQGLTEFLPISSSAHLILVPLLLGWDTPGLVFDAALHLGTLIAVVLYFKSDLWNMAKAWIASIRTRKLNYSDDSRLAWLIIAGTLPAGIIGLLFEDVIEKVLRSPVIIVYTLIGVALLLFLADHISHDQPRELDSMNLRNALVIGFAQASALIPGVSRSGITMTTGLFFQFSRPAAARFSFLLSIPIIGAGGLFKLKDMLETQITGQEIVYFAVGFFSAALSGYLCIRFLLRYLQNNGFIPFVIYRIGLGIFLYFFLATRTV